MTNRSIIQRLITECAGARGLDFRQSEIDALGCLLQGECDCLTREVINNLLIRDITAQVLCAVERDAIHAMLRGEG